MTSQTLENEGVADEGVESASENSKSCFVLNDFDDWNAISGKVEDGEAILSAVARKLQDMRIIEQRYARDLRQLASRPFSKTKGIAEGPGVCLTLSAFNNYIAQRAEHAVTFASSIESDVVNVTMLRTLENHYSTMKQIKVDMNMQMRLLADAEAFHERALRASTEAVKAAMDAVIRVQNEHGASSRQRSRFHFCALETVLEFKRQERHFSDAVQNLREINSGIKSQFKVVASTLEDMELKRIGCLKDSLMKTFVHETSRIRNCEYDSCQGVERIKNLDAHADILAFATQREKHMSCVGDPKDSSSIFDTDYTEVPTWQEREEMLAQRESIAEEAIPMRGKETGMSTHPTVLAVKEFFRLTPLDNVVQKAQAHLSDIIPASLTSDQSVGRRVDGNRNIPTQKSISDLISSSCDPRLPETSAVDQEFPGRSNSPQKLVYWRNVFTYLWKADFEKLSELGNEGWIDDLSDPEIVKVVADLLELKSIEEGVLPNMACYHTLSSIISLILNWVETQSDFWTGRSVLVSSTKILAVDKLKNNPQKTARLWSFPRRGEKCDEMSQISTEDDEFSGEDLRNLPEGSFTPLTQENGESFVVWRLIRGLYDHSVWNRVQFWEECFILTISEDLQLELLMSVWRNASGGDVDMVGRKEAEFKRSNSCLSSLGLLAHYMLSLGIQADQIMSMVRGICSRYNLGLEYVGRLTHSVDSKASSSVAGETEMEMEISVLDKKALDFSVG